jgi:hypothetical protein
MKNMIQLTLKACRRLHAGVRPIIRIWITLIAAAVYPRRVLHTCCVLLAIVFSFKCAVLQKKKVSIFCKLLSVGIF